MRRRISLLIALSAISTSTWAGPSQHAGQAPSVDEIRHALAARSGVPEGELEALLSRCDASQRSMEFCAYRDFIASDLKFKREMNQKQQQFPACAAKIAAQVATWEARREKGCAAGAAAEYGDGSLKNTAIAICAINETNSMMRRLTAVHNCSKHK